MKRRDFIQNGFNGLMAPIFFQGYGRQRMTGTVQPAASCSFDDRVLVILYLAGANDIINTAVPLNYMDQYVAIRSQIKLNENSLIHLNDSVDESLKLGLHPELQGFKNLYDQDQLAIIQRTGYPTPNRSHFASEDIMLKGIDGTTASQEGWVGRFLMDKHPAYKGLPFGEFLDPLGMILGDAPDTGFHTLDEHDMEINLSGQEPAGFFNILSSLNGQAITQSNCPSVPSASDHASMLEHLALVDKSTQVYSKRIQDVYTSGANSVSYVNSAGGIYDLSEQLKNIARFVSGGSTTKVYMARMGGWDTHGGQLSTHANLLKELSFSLEKFQQDLNGLGISNKVMTMVFSEFGRKLKGNNNGGTDHGTVSSMFVIGDHIDKTYAANTILSGEENCSQGSQAPYKVEQGIYGINHSLLEEDILGGAASGAGAGGAADPAQMQHDYRAVFASILKDWLGASTSSVEASFPTTNSCTLWPNEGAPIPIINPVSAVDSSCPYVPIPAVQIQLNLKVFLEGFYDVSTGLMTTNLNDQGLLPSAQPFGDQYFNYYGDEQVTTGFSNDIVDWILLEFYDENGLLKKRQAALLRLDGMIVNLDATLPLVVENIYPEFYKIAIHHRSHLGVLIAQSINAVQDAIYTIDTTGNQEAVLGNKQLKQIDQTVFALHAGDVDQNGLVNTVDYGIWKRNENAAGYLGPDLNADGLADAIDYNLWIANRSKIGNPTLHKNLKK